MEEEERSEINFSAIVRLDMDYVEEEVEGEGENMLVPQINLWANRK